MEATPYEWPAVDEFLNREADLDHIDRWWRSDEREPLTLLGRRRIGKSWLFRRFAHGKPAVLLVSEELPPGAQLSRFAGELEPVVGFRPELPDVQTLFQVLFRACRDRKILVVIDEFPLLLGSQASERNRNLTGVQAVMEQERQGSQLKLLLCGSQVAIMEALFSEKNPLHGRVQRFELRPLSFSGAAVFLDGLGPTEAFERYAIAGGMPMYLSRLSKGSLRSAVCGGVLDRDAPLWNEGRTLIEQELREPRVYFGILSRLATGAKELNEIAQPLRLDPSTISKYLRTLVGLRLVSRSVPLGSDPSSRSGHWELDDPFLRFWFRFTFPFQSDLESGLDPGDLFDGEIAERVADHVSPVFESWCREWLRRNRATEATRVDRWWGNATNEFRRSKERYSEEIDAVGIKRGTVTLVAEAKWTKRKLTPRVVEDLDTYKVPALRQSDLKVSSRPRIVLFSRSGYSDALVALADGDDRIELVDVARAFANRE